MASEAPRWTDQWGAGGIGAMEDDDATRSQKDMRKNKNSGGFAKIKSGASICVTWIKNQFKRNNTSKQLGGSKSTYNSPNVTIAIPFEFLSFVTSFDKDFLFIDSVFYFSIFKNKNNFNDLFRSKPS